MVSLLALLSAGCGTTDRGTVEGDSRESFTDHLIERIPALMSRYEIPGVAVALVDDGGLGWSQAFGLADVEAARPMTVETVNRTESISKSVTAWAVMTLVEEGRIDLDRPALDYIEGWGFPESPYSEESITVRHLLTHTAGLPLGTIGVHYPPQSALPTLKDNLYREASLVDDPGSAFVYSNVGFNLLELVVEGASGLGFADYASQEVLVPLGMRTATFEWRPDLANNMPTGYGLEGEPVPPYVYPEKASGGLLASVEDVARLVAAGMAGSGQAGGGVLDPSSVEQLYTSEATVTGIYRFVADSYGLGHFIEALPNGQQAVWHGGQGDGWMTHFHSVPETGDGIVVLANSQRSWPMISAILDSWSDWIDQPPVGMTIVTNASTGLWVVIGLTFGAVIWGIWRISRGLFTGVRRLAPLSRRSGVARLAMASAAALLMLALVLGVTLDLWAFFLAPLFPVAAPWLAAALVAASGILLTAALVPRQRPDMP